MLAQSNTFLSSPKWILNSEIYLGILNSEIKHLPPYSEI